MVEQHSNVNVTDCDQISGQAYRVLFGRQLDQEQLRDLIVDVSGLPAGELTVRADEGHLVFDWRKDAVSYTAVWNGAAVIAVSARFEEASLSAGQVIDCLGEPDGYQAWYDAYPAIPASSVIVALLYRTQTIAAYGSQYWPSASEGPPAVDGSLPVGFLSIFGPDWANDERALAGTRPWPGDWQRIEIKVNRHDG